MQNINGESTKIMVLKKPTLYVSPYFVTNDKGYTKHIYAGAERIVSSIGVDNLPPTQFSIASSQEIEVKQTALNNQLEKVLVDCAAADNLEILPINIILPGEIPESQQNSDYLLYFYHSDHLGSSSWITATDGQPTQHISYLPFGEQHLQQMSFDYETMRYTFSGKEKDESGYHYFGARYYDSKISIWLSVDPMASKYPSLSPYVYCANNPIKLVDTDGMSHSEFDENGNYLRTKKDNWFHNNFFGRRGRIVDGNGKVTQKFKFADPTNDVNDLKKGLINKLQFVQENEIISMLSYAGAFNYENKTANSDSRYGYISEEGKGDRKFDFATTGIPYIYPEASSIPTEHPSPMLFLVEGVAHNHLNYGNFLYGAAGTALGLSSFELRAGAHYNSLFNSSTNGYKPQFDSRDDQFSIRMGVRHAKKHGYKSMHYRVTVGSLQKS